MVKYKSKEPINYARIYTIWLNMRTRCNNPKCENYFRYDGRGIKVCKEWDSFDEFEKWAYENGYDDSLTIDRIDNDKGYSPDNCRWVTQKQQANNRKSSVYVEHNGERHTYAEWADIAGIDYKLLMDRVYHGHDFETCLSNKPLTKRNARFYEFNGEMYSINELAQMSGTDKDLIRNRLSRGWTVQEAISVKPSKGNQLRYKGIPTQQAQQIAN